jgi:spermidine/putrescine transport system permease protein
MAASDLPAPSERLAVAQALVRKRWLKSRYGLVGPAIAIVGLFGVLPLLIMLVYSFLQAGDYGGVVWNFSPEAYITFLFQRDIFDGTLAFSPDYLLIYLRSLLFAGGTTVICLVLGFPTAYFMATRPPAQRTLWVFLITIPFWSNLLVRTLAVMLIIRDEGLVNDFLIWIGAIDQPIVLLFTNFAVMVGLLYSFLPFMVLPIYASLEKMDFRLVEAGFDLYATRGKVLRRIIIPLAKPGIVAGCLLVFIPAIGAYVTPLILGGGKHLMIGALIALQFGSSRNWPLGSAMALILMVAVLVALVFYVRTTTGKQQALHG